MSSGARYFAVVTVIGAAAALFLGWELLALSLVNGGGFWLYDAHFPR